MSTPNDHDIRTLNNLIEITLDSADGYREAAKETESGQFKTLFERRSFERQQVASDLQGVVRTLGGEPEDDGSILAKAHRAFLDIKHAILRDEQAVVNSVENGEDQIKARYEKALEDNDLSATTKESVRRAYASVREGHDQMRDIKHAMENKGEGSSGVIPN